MRHLYDKILREGEPALLQLIEEKQQEGVDLDFKTKTDSACGEVGREDKKVLAKALSAFSNSMGGLIIWGMDARKNEDNIDCAIGLKPIMEIEKFRSEVNRLVSQAIMPRHEGV